MIYIMYFQETYKDATLISKPDFKRLINKNVRKVSKPITLASQTQINVQAVTTGDFTLILQGENIKDIVAELKSNIVKIVEK